MKVVTVGKSYRDIDAYACCVAYAELLRAQGEEAIAVSTATPNESIPATVRSWDAPFSTTYKPEPDDQFVLVDMSNPDWLDPIASLDRVVEVIDHHINFVAYWQTRPEVKTQIEFIGAACTLIYERWKAAGLLDRLTPTSARLLVCGILDNTLNFKANVTTDRDRAAYADLIKRADLPADWTAQYFSECQRGIEENIQTAIENDVKHFTEEPLMPECVGQLVVWDASGLLTNRMGEIAAAMRPRAADWAVNIVSIAEGCSYFFAQNKQTQAKLTSLLGVSFKGEVAKANRLWLRKEMIKQVSSLKSTVGSV